MTQDPGQALGNATGGQAGDTKYTPVPRTIADAAATGWQQVAGAISPAVTGDPQALQQVNDQPPKGMGYTDNGTFQAPDLGQSATVRSHTVDFFTVAFPQSSGGNPDKGFAGGAACKDPNATDDQLTDCVRVPVIFSYTKADGWREAYRGDEPGFVGAIAWLPDQQTAMAVGGTGCYPRREITPPPASCAPSGSADQIAGNALVWRFQSGAWSPFQVPDTNGMTALTAIDFSQHPGDCKAVVECGLVGGLGQVWMWKDGRFVTPDQSPMSYKSSDTEFSPFSPTQPDRCLPSPSNGEATGFCADEPFRIRAIRFNPALGQDPRAVAVTAGCCYQITDPTDPTGKGVADDPTVDFPRMMKFGTYDLATGSQKWITGGIFVGNGGSTTASDPRLASLRDSVYSLLFDSGGLSVVLTSGGAEKPNELSSVIAGPISPTSDLSGGEGLDKSNIWWPGDLVANTATGSSESESPQLSSVRLVAGDGDSGSQAPNVAGQLDTNLFHPSEGADGAIDWAVGELRRTQQAVAYTTVGSTASTAHAPYPFQCGDVNAVATSVTQCGTDTDPHHQAGSGYVYSLPSYPLNAFTAVGTTGVSWAAGDRGALLTLGGGGGSQQSQGATSPPKLGSGQSTALSDRSAYDSFRPAVSSESGIVPPLASRSLRDLSVGSLVPAGSPDPRGGGSITAMAMSRDGSEGWAVGDGLYHFDGTRWTRCDPESGDPACAGLASLGSARFLAMARVPLENGADSAQADNFEAVAVAQVQGELQFLRYRSGSWSVVQGWTIPQPSAAAEIAFATPDDGWLVTSKDTAHQYIWRLKGGHWLPCASDGGDPASCDDTTALLPTTRGHGGNLTDFYTGETLSMHLLSLGNRVYLYGTRAAGADTGTNVAGTGGAVAESKYPFVLSHGSGDQQWVQEFEPDPVDNRNNTADTTQQGTLESLSLVPGPNGHVQGWGIGDFQTQTALVPGNLPIRPTNKGHTPLLRFDSKAQPQWSFAQNPSPAPWEYLLPLTSQPLGPNSAAREVIQTPGSPPIAIGTVATTWLNPATDRWEVFPAPFSGGDVGAATPDGHGGYWFAVKPQNAATWFYHYTKSVHDPVFSDVPHPVRQPITAAAGGGDGSYWVATGSGTVYRWDRMTGWDQVPVKGWDAGGAVQSPAYAIAVGADGNGLLVGKQGRIADISPQGVHLDPAAVLCSSRPDSCGGGRALRAAAVAPDGSALAGGDGIALLYRPAGGSFASIGSPQASQGATITGISMPAADRAWLTTDTGDVFAGSLSGGHWSWAREDVDASGRLLTGGTALHSVAIDASGSGYAVGDHGLIMKRTPGASQPWSALNAGYRDNLWSVTLGPGGKGALVGGDAGLVLTLAGDHFEVARPSDYFDPIAQPEAGRDFSAVVGVALLPGYKAGDVEAWAAVQGANPAILHYTNDPSNPLLTAGAGRAAPSPDAPQHESGELDFAAFGKSDCPSSDVCPEFTGSDRQNEVIATRVRDSLLSDPNRPDAAIFTGDVANTAGYRNGGRLVTGPTDESRIHERWAELIGDPLARAGVPVYGALGGEDLSNEQGCVPVQLPNGQSCVSTHQTRAGLNLAWRMALAGQDAPWGTRTASSTNGLQFEEVGDGLTDPSADASGPCSTVTNTAGLASGTLPCGGARTHYAVDMVRGGQKVVRLVAVDTSLKTLAGTAGLQNPVQDQLSWLDGVLSSRPAGERAVVVSETPSYTYDPSAGGTTDTLTDSAAFEALMVKDNVSAVVSGRLGWNGLYWLVAPGLHCPRPGDSYQPDPPSDPTRCVASGAIDSADQVAASLQGLGAPSPVPSVPQPSKAVKDNTSALAPIPFVVAASAGGQFGPQGGANGNAAQGFWHGYSLLRMFPKGGVAIEQRPVFDWVGIQAKDHAIRPGHTMQLQGYGREPMGSDQPSRYDDITGPAVTHRYDLVSADPQRPWEPQVDSALKGPDNPNGYVPVPQNIGASIDGQTGQVSYTGNGDHPPFYAVGILSVRDKAATWPLVFQPRPSFKLIPPVTHNIAIPPVRVFSETPAALPQPPSAPIPKPPTLNFTFPQPPSLPSLSLNAPQTRAPVPPAPPPPPASPAASALQIAPAPVGLTLAPQTTVIPPPAPPVQPAPPSGARREARQRQAAVAKSEEGSGQEGAAQEQDGGDGKGGASAASTRLDVRRDDYAFTAHHGGGSASAWPRDLLYGGGLGIAALVLAMGWGIARPTPRRRQPDVPAPAEARVRDRR